MSKPAELREQTSEQLDLLLKDVQSNLFRLRLQSETERLEAPSEIVKAKREIARIKTILRAAPDRAGEGGGRAQVGGEEGVNCEMKMNVADCYRWPQAVPDSLSQQEQRGFRCVR